MFKRINLITLTAITYTIKAFGTMTTTTDYYRYDANGNELYITEEQYETLVKALPLLGDNLDITEETEEENGKVFHNIEIWQAVD